LKRNTRSRAGRFHRRSSNESLSDKYFDNDHSMRDDFTQTETQGAAAKPADAAEPSPRTLFWTVFPSVMLPMFLAVADQTIVATALPAITADLGGVERISWVVVSYLIANTIAAPVYGRLGDSFGRRPMIFTALALFMAGSVLCALSPSIGFLTAARVLQGLGGGGLMTLSQALVGETIPPRERGRYQGYLAGVSVASSTFGPVAGGYLTQAFGWRSIFLVNVPLGLAAAVMVLRLKTKPGDWRRTSFDAPGLVLFTLFVSPVILALEQVQRMDAGTLPLIAGLLAFGALALLALIWQEKHSTSPLIPPALFREPSVWRADAMTACHGAALVSSITFLPIYLRAVRGASPAETGLLMLPLMFGIGIRSLVTGQLVTRTGRTAAFPSYGLVAATFGLLFLALSLPHLSLFELPWVFGAIACFIGDGHGRGAGHGPSRGRAADARHRRGDGAILPLRRRRLRHGHRRRSLVFDDRGTQPGDGETVRRHDRPRARSHRGAGTGAAGGGAERYRRGIPRRVRDHRHLHRHRRPPRLFHAAAKGLTEPHPP
jgi:EmrB/QacA subfamily drug resistance transporter